MFHWVFHQLRKVYQNQKDRKLLLQQELTFLLFWFVLFYSNSYCFGVFLRIQNTLCKCKNVEGIAHRLTGLWSVGVNMKGTWSVFNSFCYSISLDFSLIHKQNLYKVVGKPFNYFMLKRLMLCMLCK